MPKIIGVISVPGLENTTSIEGAGARLPLHSAGSLTH